MGIVLVAFFAATAAGAGTAKIRFTPETDQLISESGKPVEFSSSVSILENYALALNITECTELALE